MNKAIYLGAFGVGLVLAVYSMLRGVERGAPSSDGPPLGNASGPARTSLRAPSVAVWATVFGLVGYLLNRFTLLGTPVIVGLAATLALGSAIALGAWLVQSVIPAAQQDEVDERYALQGHLARVSRPIGTTAGEIVYTVNGAPRAVTALSIDGTPLAAGVDVVIERVEHDIAYVEAWVQVEQRI
jgi:hypothetical protein